MPDFVIANSHSQDTIKASLVIDGHGELTLKLNNIPILCICKNLKILLGHVVKVPDDIYSTRRFQIDLDEEG